MAAGGSIGNYSGSAKGGGFITAGGSLGLSNKRATGSSSSTSDTGVVAKGDTWGKPIPIAWGSVRVPGALVWASPFFKTTITTDYSQDQSNLDYRGNRYTSLYNTTETIDTASIHLCYSFGFEGDSRDTRRVRRLRVNETVVYDADNGYTMPGLAFELRDADALTIPAVMAQYPKTGKFYYPGQTLVVFTAFPLTQFGNAIPSTVSAEFYIDSASDTAAIIRYPAQDPYEYSPRAFVNHLQRKVYFYAETYLAVFNIDTGERYTDIPLTGDAAGLAATHWSGSELMSLAVSERANIVFLCASTYENYYVIDLTTGAVQFLAESLGPFGTKDTFGFSCFDDNEGTPVFIGSRFKIVTEGQFWRVAIARGSGGFSYTVTALPTVYSGDLPTEQRSDGAGTHVARFGARRVGVFNGSWNTFDIADTGSILGLAVYNGTAIVLRDHDGAKYIERYEPTGARLYSTLTTLSLARGLSPSSMAGGSNVLDRQGDWRGGLYGQRGDQAGTLAIIDFRSGKSYTVTLSDPNIIPGAYYFWDALIKTFWYGANGAAYLGTGTFGPNIGSGVVTLFSLIQSLYVLADRYTFNQVRNDGVTQTIRGAIILSTIDVANAVNDLCDLFRLEKVEDDTGVTIRPRTNGVGNLDIVAVIPAEELAVSGNGNEPPMQASRSSSSDTPSEVAVRFLDVDADYKSNEAVARRIDARNGDASRETLSVPLVLSLAEAQFLAQNSMQDRKAGIVDYSFRLPTKYNYLCSGDVVQIVSGEFIDTIRITVDDYNGDHSVSCTGIGVSFTTKAPAVAPVLPDRNIGIGAVANSAAYIFDTPLLRASDDSPTGQVLHYIMAAPVDDGDWLGSYLARRAVPGDWARIVSFYGEVPPVTLRATNALANRRWITDPDSLTVTEVSGAWPTSQNYTRADIDAAADLNLAFYGMPGRWEIVQFERIVNGVVSGIVRGLRGTEVFAGAHIPGDLFIPLTASFVTEGRPYADIGKTEQYKAVSDGQIFDAVSAVVSDTIVGNSGKPFAPSNVKAVRQGNGDVLISWQRRDRKGEGWGADPLPLSEQYENYKITVGTRVLMSSASSTTYTAADQSTDGVASANTLTIRVAQIGDVGEGFSEAKQVNVE